MVTGRVGVFNANNCVKGAFRCTRGQGLLVHKADPAAPAEQPCFYDVFQHMDLDCTALSPDVYFAAHDTLVHYKALALALSFPGFPMQWLDPPGSAADPRDLFAWPAAGPCRGSAVV
jgi:hypothetical protein